MNQSEIYLVNRYIFYISNFNVSIQSAHEIKFDAINIIVFYV